MVLVVGSNLNQDALFVPNIRKPVFYDMHPTKNQSCSHTFAQSNQSPY